MYFTHEMTESKSRFQVDTCSPVHTIVIHYTIEDSFFKKKSLFAPPPPHHSHRTRLTRLIIKPEVDTDDH